jgi:hypothetical protein
MSFLEIVQRLAHVRLEEAGNRAQPFFLLPQTCSGMFHPGRLRTPANSQRRALSARGIEIWRRQVEGSRPIGNPIFFGSRMAGFADRAG